MSAIICVHNQARFIGQAVESVLRNEVDELVLYDDASTDGSLDAAIRVWSKGWPGKRTIRIGRSDRRMGIGAARNAAYRLTTGDILAPLDADDYWMPEKNQKQLALLGDRRDALVLTLVEQFLDGVPCPKILKPEAIGVPLKLPFPSNLLCHREAYDSVGDFDETLAAANDVDWFRRAFLSGIERLEVPEVLVRKRIHGANLSLHQGHDMVVQLMKAIRKKV